VSQSASIKVIRLSGELEIGRKYEIRDALELPHDAGPVLLDLGEVTYADSIALTELLRFCADAQRRDRPVAVVIKTPQFARIVQYAGLAGAFKVFDDDASARAYLAEFARPR
jgi:anti-anti-sigma factor